MGIGAQPGRTAASVSPARSNAVRRIFFRLLEKRMVKPLFTQELFFPPVWMKYALIIAQSTICRKAETLVRSGSGSPQRESGADSEKNGCKMLENAVR